MAFATASASARSRRRPARATTTAPRTKRHPARWFGQWPKGRTPQGLIVHAMGEFINFKGKKIHAPDWLDKQRTLLSTADKKGPKTSANAFIEPDGTIILSVPYTKVAYHAGTSNFKNMKSLNWWFLGVELLVSGVHTYSTFKTSILNPPTPYTDAQYRSLAWIAHTAMKKFGFPAAHIVGHSNVSPGRKVDPGSTFSWTKFKKELAALRK